MHRITGRHAYAADLAAALVLTAVYAGFAHLSPVDGQPAYDGPVWLPWAVAAAVGLPVAVRRRWPLPVLGTVMAALTAATLLDLTREPYTAAGLAAYLVGLAEPARRAVPALVAALATAAAGVYVGEAVVTPAGDRQDAVGLASLVVLVVGGAWAAGFAVRSHRARGRRRAERALTEERLRIARDLHDVVSHNLGLIAVRAGVAAHVAEADPREARVALRDIEEASRSALTEMRRALGVLRTEQAPLAPAPGLDGLDGLARDARRAGVDVRLTVRGMRGVPEGTRLMAYRIVQEALTNAVRHAAPTRCEVTVASDGAAVDIEVVDEGPAEGSRRPPGGPTGGHGLLGMRERAMMCGGAFTAGPRPQGGFAVAVRLPTGQESTP